MASSRTSTFQRRSHEKHILITAGFLAAMWLYGAGAEEAATEGKPHDWANNDTRELCIAYTGMVLREIGVTDFGKGSDLMINAHTARKEGLNCFVTINNVPYLIFAKADSKYEQGFVVRYSIAGFNTFDLSAANH